MIRVLHTLPALDGGGAEKIVYDYCMRMPHDYHFDFITHTNYIGILEKNLIQHGCNIYHISPYHENQKEYRFKIKEILKHGNYDIIHVSQGYKGLYFLMIAQKYKIPVRIAHSHMAFIPESLKDRIIRLLSTCLVKMLSTKLFACGKDAAKWMWGNSKVYIMTNSIDTDKFEFNPLSRKRIREELSLENKIVVGNVARFSYQKNHDFIIDIAKNVIKKNPNIVFLLIGRGELYDTIKKRVNEESLAKNVLFLGVRSDVYNLLNAMDVFILPSRFEGLPVTLIEAQSNGLDTIVSNKVTDEIKYASNIIYLPIENGTNIWEEMILNASFSRSKNMIKNTAYDINVSVNELDRMYKYLLKDIGKI